MRIQFDLYSNLAIGNHNHLNDSLEWETITGITYDTPINLSSYKSIVLDCTFAAGQHLFFTLIRPSSGTFRQDLGFYYSPTKNGAGACWWTALGTFTLTKPRYAESETTFASYVAYGRRL